MKGWQDRRFALPEAFVDLRVSPADTFLSEAWEAPLAGVSARDGVVCRRLASLTEDLLEAHGGIWLKVLAHLVLGRGERETWSRMSAVPRRRREWLLGRAVAKDAVRELVRRRSGARIPPADAELVADDSGRPRVRGAWTARLGVQPAVSISHSNGVAVALAALGDAHLIGIDIESVSARGPGFEHAAFTAGERDLVGSLAGERRLEWYLRLWCAKEAAGKALGRGLADGLHALEVKAAELEKGDVRLGPGPGAPLPWGRDIVTFTAREGDYVSSAVVEPR
jgi:phosphopantetheinyl transferase